MATRPHHIGLTAKTLAIVVILFSLPIVATGQLSAKLSTANSSNSKQSDLIVETAYLEVVSFKHKPVVAGTINGKTAYFLIDTGSDISIVNSSERKRCKFRCYRPMSGELKATSLGNYHGVMLGTKDIEVKLSERKVHTQLFAYNLDNIVNSMYEISGVRISGIIGSDVMSVYGFAIDYDSKTVRMGRPVWER